MKRYLSDVPSYKFPRYVEIDDYSCLFCIINRREEEVSMWSQKVTSPLFEHSGGRLSHGALQSEASITSSAERKIVIRGSSELTFPVYRDIMP